MEKTDYGQLIKECNITLQGGVETSTLNYVSGISKFDTYLNGKSFAETDYKHTMAFFEHAFVYYLYNSKEQISAAFQRNEFVEVVKRDNVKIEILNVNKFIKTLKHGNLGSGLIGGAIFKVAGLITDNVHEKIFSKSSKEVDGSIFEFIFKNKNNEQYSIKLSCEKSNINTASLFMLYNDQLIPPSASSGSACYIATVCYGDSMSLEVIKFREFRDKILQFNYLGKKFIKFYYNNAETLSKKLANKEKTNKAVKILILNPLYRFIKLLLH